MFDRLESVTLVELVALRPDAAPVLDRLGLDYYCCHGRRTLAEACAEAGLDLAAVAAGLAGLSAEAPPDGVPQSPADLAEWIVATHHRYLRAELPEVEQLAERVASVHGDRHPELAAVHRLVGELRRELEPHLDDEEQDLFPAVRALQQRRDGGAARTVTDAISSLGADHARAGELLAGLRTTTGGYAAPADGCASYRSLYDRLERLELDTHRHVHRENYVLFPAAAALAGQVAVGSDAGSGAHR